MWRDSKSRSPRNSSWQGIVMPHQDDGLPLFLDAIVCLFGSWMGSDKVIHDTLSQEGVCCHCGNSQKCGAIRIIDPLSTLPGKVLTCHTKTMDCHCFCWVLL